MRPLPITNPSHTAIELEHIARDCKSTSQARRLRAIAMVMLGAERSEAARAQAVDTQSLRDWIVLYNEGGVDGLRPARRGGRRCRLSASPLEMVAGWIDAGPEVGEDVPSRFRLRDIAERIAAVFSVLYSLQGVRKLLRRLGFRHISARPRCIPRPTSLHRRISVGTSASWRLLRRMEPGRSRSDSRTRREQPARNAFAGLGPQGHPATDPARPPLRVLLPLLRCMPGTQARRRACLQPGKYCRNEPASRRHQRRGRTGKPCGRRPGRRRMAEVKGSGYSRQHLPAASSTLQPGTEPDGKRLRVPEIQSPRQPGLQTRRRCLHRCQDGMARIRGRSRPHQVNYKPKMGCG